MESSSRVSVYDRADACKVTVRKFCRRSSVVQQNIGALDISVHNIEVVKKLKALELGISSMKTRTSHWRFNCGFERPCPEDRAETVVSGIEKIYR